MDQEYRLISLDGRLIRGAETPSSWLFDDSGYDVEEMLAIPVLPSHASPPSSNLNTPVALPRTRRRHRKRQKLSMTQGPNLSTLPTELIGAVFDELDIWDTFHLAMIARGFWDIGWSQIEKELMGRLGIWAGHRILCLGEIVDDSPPCFLNKEEKRELTEGLNADESDEDDAHGVGNPVDLCKIVDCRYETELESPHEWLQDRLSELAVRGDVHKLPRSMVDTIEDLASDEHISSLYYPGDRNWVLRNLTTHEFVRSEVLAGNSKQKGPFIQGPGFGHIVLSKILWSSSSTNSRFNDGFFNRGVWAGHRLDITTFDRHAEATRSDPAWKDISVDAVKDIVQLWKAGGTYGGVNNDELRELHSRFEGRLQS